MAKTALITGVTGQDGAYLTRLLLANGYEVHGGCRRASRAATGRLEALGVAGDVTLHDFELLEMTNMQRVLERVAPDEVYNLAAQSFVPTSFEQPVYTADADALGTVRLLECLRRSGARSRYLQASTSEMFGNVGVSPQDETTRFCPRSPYGIAKAHAHWATVNHREAFGLFACSGIMFNHESPLRGREFVTRKVTLGLARVRHGQQDVLELGNLEARRDWGFAGDYVEGMWRMLQQDTADDFVVATGVSHSVRDFVALAAEALGWQFAWRGDGPDETGFDRESGRTLVRLANPLRRPADIDALIGNAAKAERVLGWRPQVGFRELVTMMVEADERRVVDGSLTI